MTVYEMRISYWSSDVCSSDLVQEIEQLHARHLLDDHAGDDIVRVRILPLGAGREIERLLRPAIDDLLRGDGMFHRGEAVILRPVILDARGVAEKLADRDLIPQIGRASCRESVCQYV